MKRLKAGAVNSISFIRNISYTTNSFDVQFEKVVGTTALTLSGIEDQLGLADCSDFIVLNIDLVSNELDGGEYYMTITNGGNSSTYLCEVQGHKYVTHGTSIYADSVVLSTDLTGTTVENDEAVEDSEGGTTDGDSGSGSGSGTTFSVQLRDDNYGDMTSPYYVRNNYTVKANIENIGTSISTIRAIITDSSNNQIQKDFAITDRSLLVTSFDISQQTINFGDIATLKYQGLDSSNSVVHESSNYTLLIPPKMDLYVAESLSAAQDMRTNGKTGVEILNGDTTTYNVYAYLESNQSATILLDNTSIVRDKVFVNGSPTRMFGTSPATITPSSGSMQLVASDIAPAWNTELSERAIDYYVRFTWSGGYSTPLINNIPDAYNWFAYGFKANTINQRPYSKETLTIANTTFTLEGFSPIVYNSLTAYAAAPNHTLSLYMGNGSYQMNGNYINNIAVQQEYSDGTTEETIVTQADILAGQGFPAMQGDPYDYRVYISRINTSKTLVHNKVWINYGSYWFNIDNNSVDDPHFLLER